MEGVPALLTYTAMQTGTHVPGPLRSITSTKGCLLKAGRMLTSMNENNRDLMNVGGVLRKDWWTRLARGSTIIW